MRVIKFRVWDCELKEMIYDAQDESGYESDGFTDFLHQESRYKVMQFTGLLDKSGKEIWEGDIATSNYKVLCDYPEQWVKVEEKGEIIFDEKSASFLLKVYWKTKWLKNMEVSEMPPSNWTINIHPETIEIIGNVHENPELLTPLPKER